MKAFVAVSLKQVHNTVDWYAKFICDGKILFCCHVYATDRNMAFERASNKFKARLS